MKQKFKPIRGPGADQLYVKLRWQLSNWLEGRLWGQIRDRLANQLYDQIYGQIYSQIEGRLMGAIRDETKV